MWVITPDPTDSAAYVTVGADRSGQTSCMYFKTNCLQQTLHQFSWTDLPRRCHICGKIGANATRQLKSLFSSDSLYNPKGQVLPWQQLALSWAGKAYKNMITWVKKTYVCAKYVRKEHTRHSDSSAALKVKNASKSSPSASNKSKRQKVDTTQWAWSDLGPVRWYPRTGAVDHECIVVSSLYWLKIKTNNRATAFYKGFEAATPNAKACKSASSRVNPWGSNCVADN